MIVPLLVFGILLAIGVSGGDLYLVEAAGYVGAWFALFAGCLLFEVPIQWLVVPTVILDFILIFKIFGHDIDIR